MNDEGFKSVCRTLHDQLISLDHVQHLHPSIRMVRHDIREPMTAGLDELVLMQAGPLLPPTVSLGDHLHLVDQVMTDKLRLPLPLYHFRAMTDINRPGQSVQSQATPIPKLKRKDTWRSANLKHHGTGSRTMHRSRGDQIMIMALSGPFIDIFLRIKRLSGLLGLI